MDKLFPWREDEGQQSLKPSIIGMNMKLPLRILTGMATASTTGPAQTSDRYDTDSDGISVAGGPGTERHATYDAR